MSLRCKQPRIGGCIILSVFSFSVAAAQSQGEGTRIDMSVKPGDTPTVIQPKRGGMLPVGLLTTQDFDATTIDPATLRMGRTGSEASIFRSSASDVDGDGDIDLFVLFRMEEMRLECSDKRLKLTGKTDAGLPVWAEETVEMEGCR